MGQLRKTVVVLAVIFGENWAKQVHLNQTAIDAMISNSCQGDRMCETLLQELQILELRSRTRTLSKSGRDRFQHLRRLKNLKSLILHLQPEHRFGRYCNYGCWCLPTPEHDISTAGKGVPVDDIDKACKVQHFCYECATRDHDTYTCDARTKYNYRLYADDNDPEDHWMKTIECTDSPYNGAKFNAKGSCRRSICECDKRVAEQLREHFYEWSVENHSTQGTFEPDQECTVIAKAPGSSSGGGNGGAPGPKETQCCGNQIGGGRFPFDTKRGNRQCCGQKTYDTRAHMCCNDNVVTTGSC